MSLVYSGPGCVREKPLEVKQKNAAGLAVAPVMPPELLCQAIVGPMQALFLLRGSVIVYHAGPVEGDQGFVT